ncbi:unnamed protein product [Caenorhabditis angaria]|uniref:LRRCT domain-containing protein n=1 Tax=Caenorhabditis angaria TaxID=860376 RepID=A0A9P1NAL6_9PELO|nr:unnamed protein product [Caenorhabditis angaria]
MAERSKAPDSSVQFACLKRVKTKHKTFGTNLMRYNIPPSTGLRGFLATYLLATAWVVQAATRNDYHYREEAIENRLVCLGKLTDFAACQCDPSNGDYSCINAQFVDTNVFLDIATNYDYIKSVTFHGNNFQDLPLLPLFGSGVQKNLIKLNLSANYIVNLNSNALRSMPNLQILDISNNEIVFKPSDVDFLTHTPQLTELYMRRAFTVTVNQTYQFELMLEMFRLAKLEHLKILDLSYNYIHTAPFQLACPFPSLQTLDLRQNFLKTFEVNETCIKNIGTINLSRNKFNVLSTDFCKLGDKMLDNSLILKNQFYCDCNSEKYLAWIQKSNKIRDKQNLTCERASPASMAKKSIIEISLKNLTCEPLSSTSLSSQKMPNLLINCMIASIIFLLPTILF